MRATTRSEEYRGLALAVSSSAAFALSGPFARALIDTGWTPLSAVTVRTWGAFVVLLVPALIVLRGRWRLLREHAPMIAGFAVLGVAGAQLAYFNAVARMPVAVALLIEYMAPLAILAWLWAVQGQRPTRLTAAGAALSIAGLTAVLGVLGGVTVSSAGVLWASAAMVGAAGYFLIAAHDSSGLPPLVLATTGLGLGAFVLTSAGVLGFQPVGAEFADAEIAGRVVPWWGPVAILIVVTSAFAYATGVTAARILGARVMSFVALTEVLFAAIFSWLLLAQRLSVSQCLGGLLVIAGIAAVRAGEPDPAPRDPSLHP
ncbi:MAG: DMT family transporter [Baekduia sp.]